MQKHPELTLNRIKIFRKQLQSLLYPERAMVRLAVFDAPDRIPYAEAMQGDYRPASLGESFGPFWSTHWFRVNIEVPENWGGREVHFLWNSSSEATIWQDGKAMQGMAGSGGSWSPEIVRGEYVLTRKAHGGEKFELYVEMATSNLFGLGGAPSIEAMAQVGVLRQVEIGCFDRDAWDLLWDFTILADMAEQLGNNDPRGAQALFKANQMVNLIILEDRATWADARKVAHSYLKDKTGDGQLNLSAIGHAHIDTAWLWPLAETKRKCVRTFSSALRYMDEYPDYKFVCSQAQQLEWMKDLQPELYERIKQKIKSGQFVPAGGSWVEPDCNLPSGESLVRQFLYGQRFFRKEFGITCTEFWEPDVFGYSAALPQILRQAEIPHFLTIKLSWNQFNKLSAHTFLWEGIDGSRVLTHFPPADTYNSDASVKEVLYSQKNYKDLDRSRDAYLLFGYGDGGGGPTLGMLEQIERMKNLDGLPRVDYRSPSEFFERLEGIQDPMVWAGELYFELHRGTYTTQAHNKLYNRQSEFALHDVEFLSAMARALNGYDYPTAELDRMWKMTLTSQFHDIIPGSSITLVYEDSNAHYHDVIGSAANLKNAALVALLGKPATQAARVAAVNTLSADRTEVVELPDGVTSPSGVQLAANGKPLAVVSAPAYGYRVAQPLVNLNQSVSAVQSADGVTLENQFVKAVFNCAGGLVSLFDKRAARESIEAGEVANALQLFDDNPNAWDAWDVDVFHLEKPLPLAGAVSCKISEAGPLRAALEFEYALSSASSLRQTVQLSALSPRLDFVTEVEWYEQHKFLKVAFPLAVRAQNATYEVQFGHLQRPTHWNTSWDMARFEVVAHRWADLSETDFGVALLNDCKYGHAVHGNIMRLSLLRAPSSPDPLADHGSHRFTYALLPHSGAVQTAGVIEEGFRLNSPLALFPTTADAGETSFFQVSNPALILDTVKKAEDSDDLIVRLFEARGSRGHATLTVALPFAHAVRCNLLEDEGDALPLESGAVALDFKPFEIITLKLKA